MSLNSHMLRHACGYKLVNDGHDTWAIQRVQIKKASHLLHDEK
jgi:site-specific recombinase XerD